MARPRVFISSTYYDMKNVRADLEHFVRERGFDPVLHERGSVPYGRQETLERYCYKEIENCDILISVVGGRFGSEADGSTYSISQTELKVALEQSKQVYIFVERDVYHEYRTYEKNRDSKIKWASVDSVRIFEFIDEIYKLKNNNPIQPFETSNHITENLKEQWAGLFQRLLAQNVSDIQASMFQDLKHSLESAKSLMDVISAQADQRDSVVSDIILTNHPLLLAVRRIMNIPYRLLFANLSEFEQWIEARSFTRDALEMDQFFEWCRVDNSRGNFYTLQISKSLFDEDGNLKPIAAHEWTDDYIDYKISKLVKRPTAFDDDDVPF